MKTRRLIATISYNTPLFISQKMATLCKQGIVEYAHWIGHEPETDETKYHFHVLLQPSKQIDTCALGMQFNEVDPSDSTRTLATMPWRFSKFEDWILYSLHDRAYLTAKHLKRDMHYELKDVCSTHPDMLLEDYKRIDMRVYGVGSCLSDAVAHGRTWESVVASGLVPSTNWRFWKEVFSAMGGTFKHRSGTEFLRESVL